MRRFGKRNAHKPQGRRPSPALWSNGPIGTQMAFSFLLGFSIGAAAWFAAPEAVDMVSQYFGTGIHELGHAAGAVVQNGDVHAIHIDRNGGHALTSARDRVATAIAGPLMVPLMATLALAAGLCRWGLQVWLAAFGAIAILLGILTDDLIVRWTLLPWGAALILAAILPIPETVRSAALILMGLALVKGTIDGLPYLATQEVELANGEIVLSDTGRVAELLEQRVLDVRDALVLAMLLMAISGMAIVGRFLYVNRTRTV